LSVTISARSFFSIMNEEESKRLLQRGLLD
jgi:hypothetical protein